MLRTSDPRRMLPAREADVLRRSEEAPVKMNLSSCTLMLPKRATVQCGRMETNSLCGGCSRRCAWLSANGDSSCPPHRKSSLRPGLIGVWQRSTLPHYRSHRICQALRKDGRKSARRQDPDTLRRHNVSPGVWTVSRRCFHKLDEGGVAGLAVR